MTCPHEQIGTFRMQDTGEVVMWACVECRQKFVPLDVALEQDAARYRWMKNTDWYVGPAPDGDLIGVSWEDFNDGNLDAGIDFAMKE